MGNNNNDNLALQTLEQTEWNWTRIPLAKSWIRSSLMNGKNVV